ncbi:MAG: hypothetical protein U1E65_36150 [Myxococcota bacterium]
MSPLPPRTRWIARALVLGYFLVLCLGLKTAPLTDDDDFYVPAGISYGDWVLSALKFEHVWSQGAIDKAFEPNHEHPPLAKIVFGLCHFAFKRWLGPTDAARVGTMLFSTLAAWLLLRLALRHLGPERGLRVGGLAVLALLTLPRFYFHSHAATLDVPVAAMVLAAASVALAAERSTWAALAAGPVFGLALATKLNAPFLLFAYLPFVLITRGLIGSRRIARPRALGLPIPPIPLALLSMVIIGPLVFLAIWPWLWGAPVERFTQYVSFHLHHYPILFLYFGRVFSADPFAPWHAPFVTTLFSVPAVTLVLAGIGLVYAWPAIRLRRRFLEGPDDDQRRAGDLWLFVVLNAAVMIGVVAFAGTPIYGGEKLFMPFFPFLCLLAGLGADVIYTAVVEAFDGHRRGLALGFVAMLGASGVLLMTRFWGYPLSEFNGFANGLRGATALGFERQYYDLAYRDLAQLLLREGGARAKVHFLPNNWEYQRTFKWYQQAGEIPPELTVVGSEQEADLLVITHERRFARYGDDLARYRGYPIVQEKLVDGVPLWSVLRRRPRKD